MRHHFRSYRRPVEQPLGIRGREVDTAVTHRRAEIVMPISAVQAVIAVEVHDIGHIGQILSIVARATLHIGSFILDVNGKGADHRRILPDSGGHPSPKNRSLSFVGG